MWKVLIGVGLFAILAIGYLSHVIPPTTDETLRADTDYVRFLGSYAIATEEWAFETTPVGEISGLAYDPQQGIYYAISDDRGDTGTPGRLYTLEIKLDEDSIQAVEVLGVTTLDSDEKLEGIQPYAAESIDAEEVVLTPDGKLIVSSERDLENRPWIRVFSLEGSLLGEIPIPENFLPKEGQGVRKNLAFEAMTLTPDGSTLYAANEQALEQDGPLSTTDHGTTVRILQYDLLAETPTVVAEYPYVTEPIFTAPIDGDYADNGVPAMLYIGHILPKYDLLTIERAYSSGIGNDIRLFGVRLDGTDDIKDLNALPSPFSGKAAEKELLLRISALTERSDVPVQPDNIEAITFGPKLPNGNQTLLLASDNNFNDTQKNLFLAFEIIP
jgi:hypothetical protein